MTMTKADQRKLATLSGRIKRLRAIMGDQHTPVGSMKRPHRHRRDLFKMRQRQLAKLENARTEILLDATVR